MAKTYTILSSCGSGVATSSHVAVVVKDELAKRGLTVNVRTCSAGEVKGLVDNMHPQVVVTTSNVEALGTFEGVKIFSSVPVMTGIGRAKLLDTIAEYLKSTGT